MASLPSEALLVGSSPGSLTTSHGHSRERGSSKSHPGSYLPQPMSDTPVLTSYWPELVM